MSQEMIHQFLTETSPVKAVERCENCPQLVGLGPCLQVKNGLAFGIPEEKTCLFQQGIVKALQAIAPYEIGCLY